MFGLPEPIQNSVLNCHQVKLVNQSTVNPQCTLSSLNLYKPNIFNNFTTREETEEKGDITQSIRKEHIINRKEKEVVFSGLNWTRITSEKNGYKVPVSTWGNFHHLGGGGNFFG